MECRTLSGGRFTIVEGFFGDGYGVALPQADSVRRRFHKMTGMDLDDTYTGKTIAAMFKYLDGGGRERCLYWHTLSRTIPSRGLDLGSPLIPEPFRRLIE